MTTKAAAKAESRQRRSSLEAVADRFKNFRPAREVLTRVRAVPTIFPQFDHAVRVGGFPIERFSLVHGPSSHGKTTWALGLMKSFLAREHLALLIDAERTTPFDWTQKMLGEHAEHPGFYADRPQTYEATVDRVREFVTNLAEAREAEELPPETSAIIVVDSLRKLVPENILAKISKEGASGAMGSIDGMGGRAAQIKAALNAAWLDELIPLLEQTRTAFVAIERETDDPDADVWAKKYGTNFKVGGGKALYYDSSLVMRVERAKWVQQKGGDDEKATIYGERHRVTIRKTKVAGKDDKQSVAYFHTSNGVLVPEGFDRARDVLELAQRFEIVTGSAWLKWGTEKWQGEHNAVVKLTGNTDMLDELEMEVRAKFEAVAPTEVTEDGEVS